MGTCLSLSCTRREQDYFKGQHILKCKQCSKPLKTFIRLASTQSYYCTYDCFEVYLRVNKRQQRLKEINMVKNN